MIINDEPFVVQSKKRLATSSQLSSMIVSVTLLSDGTWQYTWNGPAGRYNVVLYGNVIAIATTNTYIYDLTGSPTPPPLEIVPVGEPAMTEINRPFLRIQWYGDPNAIRYEVQELGTTWESVAYLSEIGEQVYTVDTPTLTDGETHQYRVIAFNDLDGSSPLPTYFTIVVVTCPVIAELSITYSTPNITVAAT